MYTRWYEWWTSNNGWDVSEVLQRVQCPVLVVHGAEDIFFPVEHSEHIAAGCARGELAEIRGAGHEVHREALDENFSEERRKLSLTPLIGPEAMI